MISFISALFSLKALGRSGLSIEVMRYVRTGRSTNTNHGARNQRNEIRGAKQRRMCSFIPIDSHHFHGHYRIPLRPWSISWWCPHPTSPLC